MDWTLHIKNSYSHCVFMKRSLVMTVCLSGIRDTVIIKIHICHVCSETHIAPRTWWLVLWGRILKATWCLQMHDLQQVEANRWEFRAVKTWGFKRRLFLSVGGKAACICEKEQIMINKQSPRSTQQLHWGRVKNYILSVNLQKILLPPCLITKNLANLPKALHYYLIPSLGNFNTYLINLHTNYVYAHLLNQHLWNRSIYIRF